jgi:hypothetical protein
METGDKKIRMILTIPQVQALQSLLQDMLDSGEESLELAECNTLFKLKLFKDELGLVKATSIVAPKRPTLTDKLGFGDDGIPVRRIKTQEELDAELNNFDEAAFFTKMEQIQTQQSTKD